MIKFGNVNAEERYSEAQKHAIAIGALDQFNSAIADLEYRGATLWIDFAPYSFGVTFPTGIAGGLIFQGPSNPANGSAPSFTVSMDSSAVGWFLHT